MKKLLITILLAICRLSINAQDITFNNRLSMDEVLAPFYHGVASGDPLSDRVIIWTRITTQQSSVVVHWTVAKDTSFAQVVATGNVETSNLKDYTIKVDVEGLAPNTYYYYEFEYEGKKSQVGRTKTLPVGEVDNFRIALLSCSNYSYGYFNAYNIVKERNDIDLVLHVGDYIYEDGFSEGGIDTMNRKPVPEYDAFDLTSYRMRYSCYRLDPSLRNLHQQYPMVILWDDHEFANDAFSDTALNHNPTTQGPWANRKRDAIQAFKEWIPMREDLERTNVINFVQNIGDLADIIYTENRIEKVKFNDKEQIVNLSKEKNSVIYDTPNRTMLGNNQLDWLCSNLKESKAKWKIIGNQVVFAPFMAKNPSLDYPIHILAGWDGNPLDRKRVIDTINANNIDNIVVLSGDIHVAMAFDIPNGIEPYDELTGKGSLGVEFVCDNVTKGDVFTTSPAVMYHINPYLKYIKFASQGFCIIDISKEKVCCDYWETDLVETNNTSKKYLSTFCTYNEKNHLVKLPSPISVTRTFPKLVKYEPRNLLTKTIITKNLKLIGISPNPGISFIRFQYFIEKSTDLRVEIIDLQGKMVKYIEFGMRPNGINESSIEIDDLAKGEYIIRFHTPEELVSQKIIKL